MQALLILTLILGHPFLAKVLNKYTKNYFYKKNCTTIYIFYIKRKKMLMELIRILFPNQILLNHIIISLLKYGIYDCFEDGNELNQYLMIEQVQKFQIQ
ncbi:unnamed protein product [Paramecium sonneborni]|uniref:Transmembrane protein n=1 Tax=Paramecium sonneborni TaxID=65129 RepID=A0A8S1K5N6_9CILI|nr:unnamed protein product [Paramecium sonneborni]